MQNEGELSSTDFMRELAEMTGGKALSYSVLWAMMLDGRIPSAKRNGRYFIHRRELKNVAAWLKRRAAAANFERSPPPQAA